MRTTITLTLLLVGLTACGDDPTSSDASTTPTTQTATDASDGDVTTEPDGDASPTTATETSAPTEVVGDVSSTGLDERPPASTCVAFPRPSTTTGGDVAFQPAFPNMDFDGVAIALRRVRGGPDGPMRWFVLDRGGFIWTFVDANASKSGRDADDNVVEQAQVFLELPEDVRPDGEGGLLGFDFDPDYGLRADANYIYVHYTTYPMNNVWRFRVDATEAGFAIAESKLIFKTESGGGNHWGGDLKFGPDGFLYISLGDGGNGMDREDAQKTTWLRGKILRVDPRSAGAGVPYVIPASNVFAGNPICNDRDLAANTVACPEIFAGGFRNPWRMTFDRETGRLWVGDVGAGKEEVNLVVNGGNYGWPLCDGRNGDDCPPEDTSSPFTAPVAQYRDFTSEASISGGFVYRGSALGSALQGAYIFTDVYTGELMVIDEPYVHVQESPFRVTNLFEHPDQTDDQDLPRFRVLDTPGLEAAVSFAEDEDAELYVVTFGNGRGRGVYKLVPPTGETGDSVPALLSDTGCVDPNDPTKPASGMIAYDLNAPFWSDGADKSRWIAVPAGAQITIGGNAEQDWNLPIGTVVMKTFRLNGQLIETRLMVHHDEGGWAGYTWVWRADQSDADKANRQGESRQYGEQTWSYPSRSGCMNCHSATAGGTLGLETRQLNRLLHYEETDRLANQVDTFAHIGLFVEAPAAASTLPAFVDPFGAADIGERARTYLHANCANCHRAGREPDLKYTTSINGTQLCNDIRIVPGDGAGSRLVTIMRESDAGLRMPKGAGTVIDEAGIALIEQWIDTTNVCAPEP